MSDVLERPAQTIHTLTFLSGEGDTTFGWDAENDHWVVPLIQQKMDEGYIFRIVRPVLGTRRLETAQQTLTGRNARKVVISDADARLLFEQGHIQLVRTEGQQTEYEAVRRAETAREAAANDTIAHRRAAGG